MGLKQRIDARLQTLPWLVWSPYVDPKMASLIPSDKSLPFKPSAVTRFGGSIVIGTRRRPIVQVILIVGTEPLEPPQMDLEALEDQLVEALDTVTDCFPRVLTTSANYDFRPIPRGRPYVALSVQALGP